MRRATHPTLTVAACALCASSLAAQERLTGYRSFTLTPVYEAWGFGDGVAQPGQFGGDPVRVERASQWSLPLGVVIPIGERWTVDVSGAYASGEVRLAGVDSARGVDAYTLAGVSDVKLRATGNFLGDNLVVTVGVNLPAGKTELDDTELAALRVLAAPALGFQTPALGAGPGGTTGLVVARQLGGWAWAAGASYELRGTYAPIAALTAGASSPDFKPGGALHLSLGADGLVGQHGMTVNVAADVYGTDRLTIKGTGGSEGRADVRLGPTLTAEWQLRMAVPRFRELALYAVERYRSRYKQGDSTVAGSSGNYLDFGVRGVVGAGRSLAVVARLDGRHQTGLDVDNTLATAAIVSGAATVGLAYERGRYALQPFVRGQLGTIDTAGERSSARALSAGVTLGARY
jgi:hypothetical protein